MIGIRYDDRINMNGLPDVDGDRFIIEDIEGLDSAELDITTSDRHSDGGVLTHARLGPRELLIKGKAYSPVEYGPLRLQNKLAKAFVDYAWSYHLLWIDLIAPGIPFVLNNVRLGGKLHFPPPQGNVQEFEIPLTADDPRKYGQTQRSDTVNGTKTLVNAGNYPTYLTATLNSASAIPYLHNNTSGEELNLAYTPAAGTTINFLYREITVPGLGIREVATVPRIWWPLYPGNNVIETQGSWFVQWRDAYA